MPLEPCHLILFLFLFEGECLHAQVIAKKECKLWETLTILMQPQDCEDGRGLLNTPSYALSKCIGPIYAASLRSILIAPLSMKSYIGL